MKKKNTLLDFQDLLNKKTLLEQTADFLSFKINEDENEYFLIKLEEVLKIGKIDNISTLGICKDYFVGIVNLNNVICSLIDLNKIYYPNEKINTFNHEMILLRNENNYALSCFKINSVISNADLIEMPIVDKKLFIDKEYMHRENGIIYKELNVNKIIQYEDFKTTFKSF